MRIGFTGTREPLHIAQRAALADWFRHCTARELHHGDCVGADEVAHAIAIAQGWRIVVHPGLGPRDLQARVTGWNVLCPAKPNLERNRDIVNATVFLVACPKGFGEEQRSGTWATIRFARSLGRPISIIWPDGSQTFEERPPAESGAQGVALGRQGNPTTDTLNSLPLDMDAHSQMGEGS